MRNQKSIIPGIASVAFITQFGGGFASGVQIEEYFVSYGVWAFIMPVIAQAIIAIIMGYGMKLAYRRRAYNYREFAEQMFNKYGRLNMIMSNLYEVVYVLLVCLASAVAFEMGAEALSGVSGISKGWCIFIVFIFMSICTTFGNRFIRNYSIIITLLVVVGLALAVVGSMFEMTGTSVEEWINAVSIGKDAVFENYKPGVTGAINAFMGAFIYAMFQIASIGLMYQHTHSVNSEKDITKSMWLMFFTNLLVTELVVCAMFVVDKMENRENRIIPIMNLVKEGIDSPYGKLILVIVFVAAITTATNMISGIVERYVWLIQRKCASVTNSTYKYYILVSVAFVLLSFIISSIGIDEIIQKGYKYIGFGAFVTIFIPFAVSMVYHYVVDDKASLRDEWDI